MKPNRIVVVNTDWPELEKYCPNWQGMRAGLKRLGIPFKFVSCRPSLNVEEIFSFQPDLVIYALKDMITKHAAARRHIREKLPQAKIVMWYGDYRDESTGQERADCSDLDAMFISNDAQADYYKMIWRAPVVHFLPLGCEPLEQPVTDKKFAFDFVFIGGQITGTAFHSRARIIEDFKVNGGLTIVNSFEPQMRLRIFQAMPAIYSTAKISLDISHFTDVLRYTSIRYWEIPAFFGMPLTKRFPGCEEFYPENTRAYFDTFDEAMEKKNYYLTHEAERQKLITRAHERSSLHTYEQRFLQMFKILYT